jgi:hypothetical protein
MAAPNVFAIRNVAKATFYNISTGKAIVQLTNLKTSGIENSGTTVYARGGEGNPRLVGFSSERDATLTLEDAVFTNEAIAMMTGNDLTTGATPIYARDVLTVASNAVTLNYTPSAVGALIGVYVLNSDNTHGVEKNFKSGTLLAGEYSVSTKTVTFFASELANGTQVVAYYKTNTDATAKTINISSDNFAGTFKVVLDVLVRDVVTELDFAAQIEIQKAKMEDNWSITMAPEGDPSTFNMTMMVLKPLTSTELYTMKIYDEGLLA